MIKSGSNKKARGSWLAILMIAALATFAFVGCPAEQITNDSTSVSATMTPASLAAPEITGKAYDGVNYSTW
ncbi:MAG: hypothetical protein J6Y01_07875, partial [Spirochaetales bacterium]|nr:hypothetical protein [Spirochaetales bacterium]